MEHMGVMCLNSAYPAIGPAANTKSILFFQACLYTPRALAKTTSMPLPPSVFEKALSGGNLFRILSIGKLDHGK